MIQINLIDIIFILFAFIVVFFGVLLNIFESILPVCIVQSFRFGKYSHKGIKDVIISKLEIPKSTFKHFYVCSTIWSFVALALVTYVYCFGGISPTFVIKFLDFWGGDNRVAKTSAISTLFASGLLYLQCLRRLYETYCIQVFSPTSKINLSHYIVGHFHYFGAVLAILLHADGFTNIRSGIPLDNGLSTIFLNTILSSIFLFAWINQFKANLILANLRKDKKTGSVVSHQHSVPKGGWFNFISAPHMLCEVLMYVSLGGILYQNTTWWFVMAWVISNQTENALLTHWWYQKTFQDYPQKKAIYPHFL